MASSLTNLVQLGTVMMRPPGAYRGSSDGKSSGSVNWRAVAPLGIQHCQRRRNLRIRTVFASDGEGKTSQTSGAPKAEVKKGVPEEQVLKLVEANRELRRRLEELESALAARDAAEAKQAMPPVAEAEVAAEVAAVVAPAPLVVPRPSEIDWPSPDDVPPFWKRLPLASRLAAAASGPAVPEAPVERDQQLLHVVHVTAEMAPLAKVGGLGDVVTGLARACIARGHRVEVMLPFYECIDNAQIEGLVGAEKYASYHRGTWIQVQAHRGLVSGVPVIFLQPENHFFKGSRIYGGSYDELEAYLFFSRACLEYMQSMKFQPDVIHVHEWHTSGVALLYWDMYHALGLQKPRLVLTIHNMEHHGECRAEQLDMCGLDGLSYLSPEKAIDDRTIGHNPERASLLKGGIVYSNAVSTVSPTYAEETLCGGWMASTLLRFQQKYSGILNGIDVVLWNPLTDPHLPAPFSSKDLRGKQICKHYLQRGLALELDTLPAAADVAEGEAVKPIRRTPLVVCVTRLVAQKGVHLIKAAIYRTRDQGGQFVLLGSGPDPRIQGEFQALANEFKDSKNIRLVLTYSEELAHLLFAAADMLLVPSMFEPCGLTQMIAMRYGTIPVVRRTGGLADTVFDVDETTNTDNANGFVFDGIDENSMKGALDRGITYFNERPDWWAQLATKVMDIDNSWNKSAAQYVSLYNSVRVR